MKNLQQDISLNEAQQQIKNIKQLTQQLRNEVASPQNYDMIDRLYQHARNAEQQIENARSQNQ